MIFFLILFTYFEFFSSVYYPVCLANRAMGPLARDMKCSDVQGKGFFDVELSVDVRRDSLGW